MTTSTIPALAASAAAIAVLAAVTAFAGCGGTSPSPGGAPGNKTSDAAAGADANGVSDDGGAVDAEAPPPEAHVRIAQWSPDAPPLDLCLAPQGTPWTVQTPLLATRVTDGGLASGDAGAPGLAFPEVTTYFTVTPGTYAARLVAAGTNDCGSGLADLAPLALVAGSYSSVAAIGEVSPAPGDAPLAVVAFADDVAAPAAQIALRFLNASPWSGASSVDLGTGSLAGTGGAFVPVFTGVPFGQTSSAANTDAGTVDANGYLGSNPLAGATLSAHVTAAATDLATAANAVTVDPTAAATLVLLGGGSTPAALLECPDADGADGANAAVALAPCRVVSD
jgi:hypothetical protein